MKPAIVVAVVALALGLSSIVSSVLQLLDLIDSPSFAVRIGHVAAAVVAVGMCEWAWRRAVASSDGRRRG